MTLQKAIKILEQEYEKASKLEFVYDPLAYSLYKVWRMVSEERKSNNE